MRGRIGFAAGSRVIPPGFAISNAFEHFEHLFSLALAAIAWRRGEAAFGINLMRWAIVSKSSNGLDERWRVTGRHDHSRRLTLNDF
jgi:hypothetical protein